MRLSPSTLCPRCGSVSHQVAANLRLCQEGRCATVFLVTTGMPCPQFSAAAIEAAQLQLTPVERVRKRMVLKGP